MTTSYAARCVYVLSFGNAKQMAGVLQASLQPNSKAERDISPARGHILLGRWAARASKKEGSKCPSAPGESGLSSLGRLATGRSSIPMNCVKRKANYSLPMQWMCPKTVTKLSECHYGPNPKTSSPGTQEVRFCMLGRRTIALRPALWCTPETDRNRSPELQNWPTRLPVPDLHPMLSMTKFEPTRCATHLGPPVERLE